MSLVGADGSKGTLWAGPAVLLAILLFVGASVAQVRPPNIPVTKLYLLNDSDDRWCAFNSQTEWRSEVDRREALTVAVVEYAGNRVSLVQVTTEDDPGAGDWAIFDEYSVDGSQKLRTLTRTINVIPGSRRTEDRGSSLRVEGDSKRN